MISLFLPTAVPWGSIRDITVDLEFDAPEGAPEPLVDITYELQGVGIGGTWWLEPDGVLWQWIILEDPYASPYCFSPGGNGDSGHECPSETDVINIRLRPWVSDPGVYTLRVYGVAFSIVP